MTLSSFPYKWIVAIAFVCGLFMDLMDTTIVNVALPTLAKQFHAPDTTLEWVITGYLLSLAIWIPASGWIGDRFGTKKTFLFALSMFTFGSALCGLAWNTETLILFRVLQGIGGGMMTPIGTAMLFRAFPPHERAQASSIMMIPTALSPALGPVLGGYLVDYATWRWIFFVNVPIGIAAFIFGFLFLKEEVQPHPGKFDIPGFFLSGLGLVSLLYSLSQGPSVGWTDITVVFTGIAGIVLLTILIFVERAKERPLLHFNLYRDRLFRTTNIIMFSAFSVWLGVLFVLPLFLQQFRGLSALDSGLTTFPQALGWLTMSTVASRFYKKLGPRTMISAGLTSAMLFTMLFMFVDQNTNLWFVRSIMFCRGLSMSFAMIPIQAAAFANIKPEETGRASSLFNTNRQVAASFGVAILGTILFQLLAFHTDQLTAFHITFIAAAILGFIAVGFALSIKDKDAAASMKEGGSHAAVE